MQPISKDGENYSMPCSGDVVRRDGTFPGCVGFIIQNVVCVYSLCIMLIKHLIVVTRFYRKKEKEKKMKTDIAELC